MARRVKPACVHLFGLWLGDTVKFQDDLSHREDGLPLCLGERVRLVDSPNDLEAEGEVIGVRVTGGAINQEWMVQVRLVDEPREYDRAWVRG